jgi:Xaa-Pro dipeptidase
LHKLFDCVAEVGMARMRESLRAGMTEVELWSILHQTNIAHGGEWIETRCLCAGDHANPWFQEAGDRIIRPGELVVFDTDMIGPLGYCANISRTYHCGPGKPTAEQRDMYKLAYEEVNHNVSLVKPGLTFRELSEQHSRFRKNTFRTDTRVSPMVWGCATSIRKSSISQIGVTAVFDP